jgi:uncharacterized protein (TIGR02058 family)
MAEIPYLMQTGMGVDLHGADDTIAARRAVENAIRHNSLLFLRQIGLQSADQIRVEVTIGTPHPEQVDAAAVAAALPVGRVSVVAERGGLLTDTAVSGDPILVAVAAVLVSVADA